MYLQRLKKLQNELRDNQAFFLRNKFNIFYFSGFWSSNAFLIIEKNVGYFFTDFRYLESAEEKISHLKIMDVQKVNIWDFLKNKNYEKVYFENSLEYYFYSKLLKSVKNLSVQNNIIEFIRAKKDDEEIKAIKLSLEFTTKVFDEMLDYIRKNKNNISEWEIVKFIRKKMDDYNFDNLAFEPIVAFGKNAASPHYKPQKNRYIKNNDLVILIDFGYIYENYNSDFTRTIFLKYDAELVKLYKFLAELYEEFENENNIKTVKEIDLFFREKITRLGYGENFRHATGHSIGIECHEYPPISSSFDIPLFEGLTFTIEPGIYIPEKGGVRLEDVFTYKNGRFINLTSYSRDIIFI